MKKWNVTYTHISGIRLSLSLSAEGIGATCDAAYSRLCCLVRHPDDWDATYEPFESVEAECDTFSGL